MIDTHALRQTFQTVFPHAGAPFVVAAPGRVDLLGSHNDYNGLPVLTMTLDRAIYLAAAPATEAVVTLADINPKFEATVFSLGSSIEHARQGHWSNYCRAAAQWLLERNHQVQPWRGMHIMVDTTLPMGCGLSSSSALVVGNALALLRVNGIEVDRTELAEALAEAEHYVGTAGGGMDQASCLLGRSGSLLRLDFFPLRAQPEPIPDVFDFVLVNSLIQVTKTQCHLNRFNRLVVECRLAAAMIHKFLELDFPPDRLPRLGDIPPEHYRSEGALDRLLGGAFPGSPLTTAQIAEKLNCTVGEVVGKYCVLPNGRVFQEPESGFLADRKARHILGEALRVEAAVDCLQTGRPERLPELINAGYRSSRDHYGVSTPAVDQLVELIHGAGALATRLPGAGFGGALVCVVPKGGTKDFRAKLYDSYYTVHHPDRFPPQSDLDTTLKDLCFPVTPAGGARIED